MTALADAGSSRVVLIGIDRYETLAELPGVRNNLEDLRRLLQDEGYWGIAEDRCAVRDAKDSLSSVAEAMSKARWRAPASSSFATCGNHRVHDQSAMPRSDVRTAMRTSAGP